MYHLPHTQVFPLLAVTILSFRKESLMSVTNMQSVEAVLADLSSLPVIPLLQMALEKEQIAATHRNSFSVATGCARNIKLH